MQNVLTETFVEIAMNFLNKLRVITSELAISICKVSGDFLRERPKL